MNPEIKRRKPKRRLRDNDRLDDEADREEDAEEEADRTDANSPPKPTQLIVELLDGEYKLVLCPATDEQNHDNELRIVEKSATRGVRMFRKARN
jgi:hypothetical protein